MPDSSSKSMRTRGHGSQPRLPGAHTAAAFGSYWAATAHGFYKLDARMLEQQADAGTGGRNRSPLPYSSQSAASLVESRQTMATN